MQKKVIECKVREKSMKKKITIAVVILVIIAIGAATGYHFYSKRFITRDYSVLIKDSCIFQIRVITEGYTG